MKNNIVDKVYLALELTRLWNIKEAGREDIMKTYNYFLNELTGIDSIGVIDELNEELENITNKYNDLEKNMESIINERINYKKDVLRSTLENAKGDMEPYVYESLTKLIK